MFRDCTGLKPNTEKTESMSCCSGAFRGRCSMKSYKRRHEGTRDIYSKTKGKRTICPVPSCGKDLALGSLQSHVHTQHGMDASGSIITKLAVLAPRLYKLSFIRHLATHNIKCGVRWRITVTRQKPQLISDGISSIATIHTYYT